MKTLLESIFDDNIKPFKFGDVFKLDRVWSVEDDGYRSNSKTFKNYKLTELYNSGLILKDSKVGLKDPKEIIIGGLTKLISELPITSKMSNHNLTDALKKFNKYYKSVVNNTRKLKARSSIFCFSEDIKFTGDTDTFNNWNILDVNSITIKFCDMKLTFEKK